MKRYLSADLTRQEIERLRSSLRRAQDRARVAQRREADAPAPVVPDGAGEARQPRLRRPRAGHRLGGARHRHLRPRTRTSSATATSSRSGTAPRAGEPARIEPGAKGFDDLDGNGHGTHVAATIAGAHLAAAGRGHAPRSSSSTAWRPEAKLYGFKVLENNGNGEDAFIIKALDTIARPERARGPARDPRREPEPRRRLRSQRLRLRAHAALPGAAPALAAGRARRARRRQRGLRGARDGGRRRCRRTWTSRSATRPTSRRRSPSARSTRPTRTPTASRTSRRAGRRPTGAQAGPRGARRADPLRAPRVAQRRGQRARPLRRDERHQHGRAARVGPARGVPVGAAGVHRAIPTA